MPKFRKKPVEIEARRWDGTAEGATAIINWVLRYGSTATYHCTDICTIGAPHTIRIPTPEGDMMASVGDWIIRGVQNEFYPCKPSIFADTYDEVPCPNDTDGDGNCGKPACPYCGEYGKVS